MTYTIEFSDPSKSPIVVEFGERNQNYDLVFFGQASIEYAEDNYENTVRLLEKQASPIAPSNPVEGELWFDTNINTLRLAVSDGAVSPTYTWQLINIPVSSVTSPDLSSGLLWFDINTQQLKVSTGTEWISVAESHFPTSGGTISGELIITGNLTVDNNLNVVGTQADVLGVTQIQGNIIVDGDQIVNLARTSQVEIADDNNDILLQHSRSVSILGNLSGAVGGTVLEITDNDTTILSLSDKIYTETDLNIQNNNSSNLASGVNPTDAINKGQLDVISNAASSGAYLSLDGTNGMEGRFQTELIQVDAVGGESQVTLNATVNNIPVWPQWALRSESKASPGELRGSVGYYNGLDYNGMIVYDTDTSDAVQLKPSGSKIINVRTPTQSTDGAPKGYVDNEIANILPTSEPNFNRRRAKAFIRFNTATGEIVNSFNISSLSIISVGQFRITFAQSFDSANYMTILGTIFDETEDEFSWTSHGMTNSNGFIWEGESVAQTTSTCDLVTRRYSTSGFVPTIDDEGHTVYAAGFEYSSFMAVDPNVFVNVVFYS